MGQDKFPAELFQEDDKREVQRKWFGIVEMSAPLRKHRVIEINQFVCNNTALIVNRMCRILCSFSHISENSGLIKRKTSIGGEDEIHETSDWKPMKWKNLQLHTRAQSQERGQNVSFKIKRWQLKHTSSYQLF